MIAGLEGSPLEAARSLLGRRLETTIEGAVTAVVITEVEAYGAGDDAASHAHRGRTGRNAAMFGPPGTLYVYRSYGIHWCLNIVCGPEGRAGAVLVRGGRPVAGVDSMVRRRGRTHPLTDGPGKLCQALGIGGQHDGRALDDGIVGVGEALARGRILAGPRIGVSQAQDLPWRLVLVEEATG